MPLMPCFNTSSATLNASPNGVEPGSTCKSLSLGMTTNVSTYFLRLIMPFLAFSSLFLPSKENGLVTTATVRTPISLAIRAITGAAPVPVPPPIPAAIKRRSVPLMSSVSSSLFSSAARSPISGFAPAPRPFVSPAPICMRLSALDSRRTCLSVFTEMNSALVRLESIIELMALFPPPPTPITLITAMLVSSLLNIMFILHLFE